MSEKEDFVVAERPRISAAAVLLMILIFMNAVSIFGMMSYWARVQQLENEIGALRAEVKSLSKELSILNENIKHYKRIDELVQLYVQQMVIKMYKELFPELSPEQIKELIESSGSSVATQNSTETVIVR